MTSVQATPPLTSAEKFSAASLNLDLEGRPAGLELLGTRSYHNDVCGMSASGTRPPKTHRLPVKYQGSHWEDRISQGT